RAQRLNLEISGLYRLIWTSRLCSMAIARQSSRDNVRTSGVFVCARAPMLRPIRANKILIRLIAREDWSICCVSSNTRWPAKKFHRLVIRRSSLLGCPFQTIPDGAPFTCVGKVLNDDPFRANFVALVQFGVERPREGLGIARDDRDPAEKLAGGYL